MNFAYADPPYLGCGRLYAQSHPDALIWDDPETHSAPYRATVRRMAGRVQAASPLHRPIVADDTADVPARILRQPSLQGLRADTSGASSVHVGAGDLARRPQGTRSIIAQGLAHIQHGTTFRRARRHDRGEADGILPMGLRPVGR